MFNKEVSLKSIIFRSYRKTTLIPIIIVFIIVFSSIFYLLKDIAKNHEKLFLIESEKNILNITKETASFLHNYFDNIAYINKNFSDIHQQYINFPDKFKKRKLKMDLSKNGSLYKKNNKKCFFYSSIDAKINKQEMTLLYQIANAEYIYEDIVKNNNSIHRAYYVSDKGVLIGYPFIVDIDKKVGPIAKYSANIYFKDKSNKNLPVWTGLYVDALSESQMISCLAPIKRKNKIIAFTGIDIDIGDLNKHLFQKWSYSDTESFILNKNGRLIDLENSINSKPILKKLIANIKINNKEKRNINLLNLNNINNVNKIKKMLIDENFNCYININNKEYFLTQDEIKISGWKLFTITSKESMVNSIKKQMVQLKKLYLQILLLICFLTLIAIIFIYIQSRKLATQISKPIENLEKAIEKGQVGKFKIQYSKISEVNSLALSFNNLLNKLQLSQNQLEIINDKLKVKFEKEVEKNREQESLVFQQARLIQMGELVGNIAHQWRQPLNCVALIIQSITMASQENTLNEKLLQEQCDTAMNLINKMSETIDNFRNFFKTDDIIEIFNINKQIEKTVKIVKSSFEDRGIKLITDLGENMKLEGNKQVLSQIVLNLLSNAENILKERKIEQKIILIKSQIIDNKIHITIMDSAGGVNSDIIEKIFNPFFTTDIHKSNAGLGLYMSKMLITENFNGKLKVENEYFNINNNKYFGACFKIEIPIK